MSFKVNVESYEFEFESIEEMVEELEWELSKPKEERIELKIEKLEEEIAYQKETKEVANLNKEKNVFSDLRIETYGLGSNGFYVTVLANLEQKEGKEVDTISVSLIKKFNKKEYYTGAFQLWFEEDKNWREMSSGYFSEVLLKEIKNDPLMLVIEAIEQHFILKGEK